MNAPRFRGTHGAVRQTVLGLDAAPRVLLDDGPRASRVTYEPGFLPRAEADALFTELAARAPWETEAPVMFGRAIEVRRRSCAFGDAGRRYRYTGIDRVAHPWPQAVGALRDRLERHLAARFNYVLCNLYLDGDAALGWHADDEADLARDAPIASVSLGAERAFAMRMGRSGPACLSLPLAHGSLLVMWGATQRHYQHQVPRRARCREPRVNLTFRCADARVDG